MSNAVTINGVEYPSQLAVARAFGIDTGQVCRLARQGRLVSEIERILREGKRTSGRDVETTIAGVVYPTQTAAAKAFGVEQYTINRLTKSGRLDAIVSVSGSGSGRRYS